MVPPLKELPFFSSRRLSRITSRISAILVSDAVRLRVLTVPDPPTPTAVGVVEVTAEEAIGVVTTPPLLGVVATPAVGVVAELPAIVVVFTVGVDAIAALLGVPAVGVAFLLLLNIL